MCDGDGNWGRTGVCEGGFLMGKIGEFTEFLGFALVLVCSCSFGAKFKSFLQSFSCAKYLEGNLL